MTTREVDDQRPDAGPAQVVSVRFAPEELGRLKQIAEAEQIPLSSVIRRAVLSSGAVTGSITQAAQSKNSAGVGVVGDYTVFGGSAVSTVGTSGQFNVQFDGGAAGVAAR